MARKHNGSDTWHWYRNSSNWPTTDYTEKPGRPTSGDLCNEYRSKEKDERCQAR